MSRARVRCEVVASRSSVRVKNQMASLSAGRVAVAVVSFI